MNNVIFQGKGYFLGKSCRYSTKNIVFYEHHYYLKVKFSTLNVIFYIKHFLRNPIFLENDFQTTPPAPPPFFEKKGKFPQRVE